MASDSESVTEARTGKVGSGHKVQEGSQRAQATADAPTSPGLPHGTTHVPLRKPSQTPSGALGGTGEELQAEGRSGSPSDHDSTPMVQGLPPDIVGRFEDLYRAAKNGNWVQAEEFRRNHPDIDIFRIDISHQGMKLLHVAAKVGKHDFMMNLLKYYTPEDLENIRDKQEKAALHTAAENGNLMAVKLLVDKNPKLTSIKKANGTIPVLFAAILGPSVENSKDIISYLADRTEDPFVQNDQRKKLLTQLTLLGFHDITLRLLKKYPDMILKDLDDQDRTKVGAHILNLLAFRPYDFRSGCELRFWENWMYKLVPDQRTISKKRDTEASNDEKAPRDTQWPPKSHAVTQWLKRKAWKLVHKIAPDLSNDIQEKKHRHIWAVQLVKFIRNRATGFSYADLKSFRSFVFLNTAATAGVVEIVELWLDCFPYPVSFRDVETTESGFTPLHCAVKYKQEKVFNVILLKAYKQAKQFAIMTIGQVEQGKNNPSESDKPNGSMGHPEAFSQNSSVSDVKNQSANNPGESDKLDGSIVHLAASLAPPGRLKTVPGAALQMQRELQWFQEVQKLVGIHLQELRNGENKTAQDVFTEQHKELAKTAEEWMKDTSDSCMVVTALIATVVFAAAFTVPGGNNDQGFPVFNGGTKFTTFIVSDIVALFTSLTSLLFFLSLLNSRFSEDDFAQKVPVKLILGFAMEFIAMAAMMVSFVTTLWITLDHKSFWASALASVFAAIPLLTFLILQLPDFIETCNCTWGGGIFHYEQASGRKSWSSLPSTCKKAYQDCYIRVEYM